MSIKCAVVAAVVVPLFLSLSFATTDMGMQILLMHVTYDDWPNSKPREWILGLIERTHTRSNPMFQWNIANFGVMERCVYLLNFQFLLFVFWNSCIDLILLIAIQFWFRKSFFFICVTRFSNFGTAEFYFSPVIFYINCWAGAYEIQSNMLAYDELNIRYMFIRFQTACCGLFISLFCLHRI